MLKITWTYLAAESSANGTYWKVACDCLLEQILITATNGQAQIRCNMAYKSSINDSKLISITGMLFIVKMYAIIQLRKPLLKNAKQTRIRILRPTQL
jgi:hypothetical protein